MAEPPVHIEQDGEVVMAILVPSDSDNDFEVEVVEVCMGVVVDSPPHADLLLPPEPPPSCTGSSVWEQIPSCAKPVRRAGVPNATWLG